MLELNVGRYGDSVVLVVNVVDIHAHTHQVVGSSDLLEETFERTIAGEGVATCVLFEN